MIDQVLELARRTIIFTLVALVAAAVISAALNAMLSKA